MPQFRSLRFETDAGSIRTARRRIRDLVLTLGGSEEDAAALEIAMGELLINAHEQGYAGVDIDLLYNRTRIELTVHNSGKPITDAATIPRVLPSDAHGRGLYLVGQLTDDAEILHAADGRPWVGIRLAKYLGRHYH